MVGPPTNFAAESFSRKRDEGDYTYRLMWRTDRTVDDNKGDWDSSNSETPPKGLAPAGEGADPGLFDVEAQNGTITALPRRNGDFSMYLIAFDAAGSASDLGLPAELDQVIVKRWDFTVVGKPDFKVNSYSRVKEGLPAVSSGEDPFITRSKVGAIDVTVGTIYHIAPIDQDTLAHEYASGGDQARIRFTIRNPPPGFFIDPNSGEILGSPLPFEDDQVTQHVSQLLAVDPSGADFELEEIEITIHPRPTFVPVFKPTRTYEQQQQQGENEEQPVYTNPSAQAQAKKPFVVGSSYRFAAFELDVDKTTVSAGEVDDISYTLSAEAPDSLFVNSRTGDIFGTFLKAGNYTFSLLAVDQAGAIGLAEQFVLLVEDRPVFTVVVGANRESTLAVFSDPLRTEPFIANTSYRFSPLELIEAETTVSAGTFADITYTLESSDGWFVSAHTGESFGQFHSVGEHTLTLYAVDFAGKQDVVETITFDVQPVPEFRVVLGSGRVQTGAEFLDPSSNDLEVIANESYRISPPLLDSTRTTTSSGSFADITYTLIASDGWFISASSGEIFGQFRTTGRQTIALYAVDASGVQQLVEEMIFVVQARPVFAVGFTSIDGHARHHVGVPGYTDPLLATEYIVGSSYKVAPLVLSQETTTLSDGDFGDITFTLSSDAPKSFFVQARSGVCFGTFDAPGTYSFALLAVDRAGHIAEVERYSFNAVPPAQFVLGINTTAGRGAAEDNSQYTDPFADGIQFFVDSSYKIAPLTIDRNATHVSAGSVDDITCVPSICGGGHFEVSEVCGFVVETAQQSWWCSRLLPSDPTAFVPCCAAVKDQQKCAVLECGIPSCACAC
jgi:hypothetical protein